MRRANVMSVDLFQASRSFSCKHTARTSVHKGRDESLFYAINHRALHAHLLTHLRKFLSLRAASVARVKSLLRRIHTDSCNLHLSPDVIPRIERRSDRPNEKHEIATANGLSSYVRLAKQASVFTKCLENYL